MIPVFATPEELKQYTGKDFPNAVWLLERASESIGLLVTVPIVDDLSNVTEAQKEALKLATLAQASYIGNFSEGFDVAVGVIGSVSIGNFSFSGKSGSDGGGGAISQYNPIAIKYLMKAGLLTTKGAWY
ncbi:hypothetical protein C1X05_00140 [Laceyella sacchari]|uniref:Head-to-tail adaptor n=1 Tax=Laceyella tengchongensis TaxID=574699 RepID=A0AA45WQA6_9BACL|nr:hypothetical protein [Laceyella tengchongensis]AUS07421.1 hypothetical protein C1X05_00140 [Laceyella sacchari]SMP25128.1 hypothetical protein SAMN06265361_10520 [Laceyella tengchongensis]